MGTIEADYVAVGAGAAGMAFADALIDHADVRGAVVDRRHAPGGHWLEAYPFVRLHQASAFYDVASTLQGEARVQERGPERGLHERATAPEICAYFGRVMARDHDVGDDDVGCGDEASRVQPPRAVCKGPSARGARLDRAAAAAQNRTPGMERSRRPGDQRSYR